ncbi:pickpocket protein 19 [Drosophila tropicalis]|uniref:pickpocket protein 19 n=1 Tax=Drosophila tropicalis TaxID=46794 RepID=UPI0035ABFB14
MKARQVEREVRLPKAAWKIPQKEPLKSITWMQLLDCYASRSHIHGLYQVFLPTIRLRMRLLWALALFCAISVLIYVSYLLAERYQRKHFQTTIAAAHLPMYKFPFPVVIICNKNRLNWSRLPQIEHQYNITSSQKELFERTLTAYDALSFAHFNVFNSLMDEDLLPLNHLNFTKIVTEMSWRCDELLEGCIWEKELRNCCDLFHPRRQTQGLCLAFNEQEQRRNYDMGPNTGLMVRLLLHKEKHAPGNERTKGFVIDIVEPFVWFGFPVEIVPYTRTNIGVTGVYHYYDESTYSMPSGQRRCVMDYERESEHFRTLQGQKYMLENCLAECQQRHLLAYCNCTLDLFYPPSNYKACELKDLPCLAAHNYLLQNYEEPGEHPYVHRNAPGLICDCLHNCKSLTLMTEIRKKVIEPWKTHNSAVNNGMLLNVFYKRPGMLAYKTNLIYSWLDLLVSFGGICQLCLGCSIISLIELMHFGLVDIPNYCWLRWWRN